MEKKEKLGLWLVCFFAAWGFSLGTLSPPISLESFREFFWVGTHIYIPRSLGRELDIHGWFWNRTALLNFQIARRVNKKNG